MPVFTELNCRPYIPPALYFFSFNSRHNSPPPLRCYALRASRSVVPSFCRYQFTLPLRILRTLGSIHRVCTHPRRDGGHGNAHAVREVAWILQYKSPASLYKGEGVKSGRNFAYVLYGHSLSCTHTGKKYIKISALFIVLGSLTIW